MKKNFILNKNVLIILTFLVFSCKKEDSKLKQEKLNELYKNLSEINSEIKQIESELGVVNLREVLIDTMVIKPSSFQSYLELIGNVISKKNVLVSPDIVGVIEEIKVVNGQFVKENQILVEIECSALKKNYQELKENYNFALDLYNKQKELFEKKVIKELDYLDAKNQKNSLELKMASLSSQIKKFTIKAPFNGLIDQVFSKVGEIAAVGNPILRIIDNKDLLVELTVMEKYSNRFKVGDLVKMYPNNTEFEINTKINSISNYLNPLNRTYLIELGVPNGNYTLLINQGVKTKLKLSTKNDTKLIPINILQTDFQGSFIYKVEQNDNELRAKKQYIELGEISDNYVEVISGLKFGDVIVTNGYNMVSDLIKVQINKSNLK